MDRGVLAYEVEGLSLLHLLASDRLVASEFPQRAMQTLHSGNLASWTMTEEEARKEREEDLRRVESEQAKARRAADLKQLDAERRKRAREAEWER
jgi:hypothetical protein